MKPGVILIRCIALLHGLWAVLLVWWGDQIASTPVASILHLLPRGVVIGLLLGCSLCALWAVGHRQTSLRTLLWLMPQQILMMMTALGCLVAVIQQRYADGVPRPWPFILSDQLPVILLAIFHTEAILGYSRS